MRNSELGETALSAIRNPHSAIRNPSYSSLLVYIAPTMSAPPKIDITEVIDKNKIGRFQTGIFVLCGLCLIMVGFDVQALGYLAPAIIQDWKVSRPEMGAVLSAALVGILVGSLLFSMLADKFGRRPMLIIGTALFGVLTLIAAQADSPSELRILRFFGGVAMGGMMPNVVALIGEYMPQRLRVRMMILVGNGFNLGAVLAGLTSAWLVPDFGWRAVLYVGGALPLLIVLFMFAGLPESLQFMALRNKNREKLGKWLKRIDETTPDPGKAEYVVNEHKNAGVPIVALFHDGRGLGTALIWVINFMNLLNLYFLASWSPTVVSDAGYSLRISSLAGTTLQIGGLLGTFVFAWLIGRYGFVPVLGTSFLIGCVTIIFIGQPAIPLALLFTVIFVSGFCIVGAQGSINALSATYYPTDLRATGVGAGLGVGRFGGIVGPYLAGALMGRSWVARELFFAAAIPAMLAAATVFSLRRVMKLSVDRRLKV
jgi:AAHS family 4-hydroxybenzoate transporter-like MFS transporter